jgi:hypothetical protein
MEYLQEEEKLVCLFMLQKQIKSTNILSKIIHNFTQTL